MHPDNSDVLVLAEGESYDAQCALHVSTDAGLSWTTRELPHDEDWPECMYSNLGPIADVAFAPDGTLYVAHSGHDPQTYHSRIFVSRTADLGRSFDTTAVPRVGPDLDNGEFGADAMPAITLDPEEPERIYVGWMSNNGTWNVSEEVLEGNEYYVDIKSRAHLAVSDDGGESFEGPVDLARGIDGWFSQPDLAVDTDGAVHAFFGEHTRSPADADDGADAPGASIWHAMSADGGETVETEAVHTREPRPDSDWASAPTPAVDRTSGDLYLVFEESPVDEPPFVAFMRSQDGGQTWSEPVAVNDAEPEREWTFNEFFPSVAVAPNGRIDVAWYDWRDDVAYDAENDRNALQHVYATHSDDGGRSWAPNVRVSDRAIDRRIGLWSTYGVRGPVGLASTNEAMHLAWDDTRNGHDGNEAQDIYATRARFVPAAEFFGGAGDDRGAQAVWAGSGVGGALLVGGGVLLLLTRSMRRAG